MGPLIGKLVAAFVVLAMVVEKLTLYLFLKGKTTPLLDSIENIMCNNAFPALLIVFFLLALIKFSSEIEFTDEGRTLKVRKLFSRREDVAATGLDLVKFQAFKIIRIAGFIYYLELIKGPGEKSPVCAVLGNRQKLAFLRSLFLTNTLLKDMDQLDSSALNVPVSEQAQDTVTGDQIPPPVISAWDFISMYRDENNKMFRIAANVALVMMAFLLFTIIFVAMVSSRGKI